MHGGTKKYVNGGSTAESTRFQGKLALRVVRGSTTELYIYSNRGIMIAGSSDPENANTIARALVFAI